MVSNFFKGQRVHVTFEDSYFVIDVEVWRSADIPDLISRGPNGELVFREVTTDRFFYKPLDKCYFDDKARAFMVALMEAGSRHGS